MVENLKKRDLSIDAARIFAILLVVIGHSLWFSSLKYNTTAQLIFYLFFSSVPLFFFLSGYSIGFNLDSKEIQSFTFLLKRSINKLLKPLLIWISIYIIWTFIYYSIYPSIFGRDPNYTVLQLIGPKFKGFHLWFVIALIVFYILSFYLRNNERYKKNKYLVISIIVSLFFTAIQYLEFYYQDIYLLQFTPFPYTFFFVWGLWSSSRTNVIRNLVRKDWIFKILAILTFFIGIVIMVIETLKSPIGVSNVRISIFVISIGLILIYFVFALSIPKDKLLVTFGPNNKYNSIFVNSTLKLAQAIGGVYFIHIIVLDTIIILFVLLNASMNSLIVIASIALLTPMTSFIIIIYLQIIMNHN